MVRTYHSTQCHIPVTILMFTVCSSWFSVKFALGAARSRYDAANINTALGSRRPQYEHTPPSAARSVQRLGGRLEGTGLESRQGERFFCSPKCLDRFWSPPSPCSTGAGVFSGCKAPAAFNAPPTSIWCQGYEWAEVYVSFPYMPSWRAQRKPRPEVRFVWNRMFWYFVYRDRGRERASFLVFIA